MEKTKRGMKSKSAHKKKQNFLFKTLHSLKKLVKLVLQNQKKMKKAEISILTILVSVSNLFVCFAFLFSFFLHSFALSFFLFDFVRSFILLNKNDFLFLSFKGTMVFESEGSWFEASTCAS